MNIASRFQTSPDNAPVVHIFVDGDTIATTQGISLAAALLAHSGGPTRKTVNGSDRTAFCMMGVCFDCLVEVDGKPNTQACTTPVRDGMVVKHQIGLRGLSESGDV
jgi:predicted molibdopterin-dependent oxidoreductase YjgC